MATFIERRIAEARVRAKALGAELASWRDASEAGKPLEKHHSQIRRIAAILQGLLDRVTNELDASAPTALARIRGNEERLLTAHTIWEFFRSKLAQRLDASFGDYLRVCDDLAWNCYAPASEKFQGRAANVNASSGRKEPPLVFLNAGWSPFAMGRDAAFQVDRVAGGWLAQEEFRSAVERLPVPLIGLPWYQVAHLPDVLVTAHEVGHIVEWDFGLRADLLKAIDGTGRPADRAEAWAAWQPEVFADLYGCLACGPAFAASLIDFFAVDVAKVTAEQRKGPEWGAYPPTWLRAQLLATAVRELGFTQDADGLAARWKEIYGEPSHNTEFASDVAPVAKALLDCQCESLGVSVRHILPGFAVNDRAVAQNLARNYPPGTENTRILLAAARWLWESDPEAYAANKQDARIRSLVQVPPGTRRGSTADELPTREESDRETGDALFDSLFPDGGGD